MGTGGVEPPTTRCKRVILPLDYAPVFYRDNNAF